MNTRYIYDAIGRVITIENLTNHPSPEVVTTIEYDVAGRIIERGENIPNPANQNPQQPDLEHLQQVAPQNDVDEGDEFNNNAHGMN